jgi:hypothetical protein
MMASSVPGSAARPSTTFTFGRSSKAFGVTPRTCRLAVFAASARVVR